MWLVQHHHLHYFSQELWVQIAYQSTKLLPEGEFITESTAHIAEQRELFICGALIFADLELAAQFDALTHVG